MSDSDLRERGIPVNRRSLKGPHNPSLSPSTRRRSSSQLRRRIPRPSTKPIEFFERCSSEPVLLGAGTAGGGGDDPGQRPLTAPETEGVLCRPQTCTDIFSSPDYVSFHSPPRKSLEGYKTDSKVVINVTVEGSPGPVRVLVKLGSSVEETIKLVVNKYIEEGRTPYLDKEAVSTFELHNSYFSLECMDKADTIGDAGSRNFYLRKRSSSQSSSSSLSPDSHSDGAGYRLYCSPLISLQNSICRKINKMVRKTHKLWKLLGCLC
ncbi:OLC1v1029421C1 [Oldenlandia corymbosa var. corymbosa]|uniref:OLC1v1029421C1 n=1 Tax=Oldenlandia corymbosa var. corymbosa TaxID=529605 RepID=A0AAV1CDU8_OLDCO|nr:OLC1v1029421C1 [Oldenlandia corymbosa var. corymbosa]